MDIKYKKELVERIKNIKNYELSKKIFVIVLKNGYKYNENANGVFFNIFKMSDTILYDIDSIVKEFEILTEDVAYNKLVN